MWAQRYMVVGYVLGLLIGLALAYIIIRLAFYLLKRIFIYFLKVIKYTLFAFFKWAFKKVLGFPRFFRFKLINAKDKIYRFLRITFQQLKPIINELFRIINEQFNSLMIFASAPFCRRIPKSIVRTLEYFKKTGLIKNLDHTLLFNHMMLLRNESKIWKPKDVGKSLLLYKLADEKKFAFFDMGEYCNAKQIKNLLCSLAAMGGKPLSHLKFKASGKSKNAPYGVSIEVKSGNKHYHVKLTNFDKFFYISPLLKCINRALKSKNSKRRFYCINVLDDSRLVCIFLLSAKELKKILGWLGLKRRAARGNYLIMGQK